jgi:glutamyl/glutaminyl-tRNA synthetase
VVDAQLAALAVDALLGGARVGVDLLRVAGVGVDEDELADVVEERRDEQLGVKPKEVFQPVRVAITGSTISPGIFESLAALGRERTLERLDAALARA